MGSGESNTEWHTIGPSDIYQRHATSEEGLSEDEAARRLSVEGPNRLPEPDSPSLVWVLLRQFHNPLIYILAVAALLSLGIGEYTDAGFVAVILLLNASIGGFQEWQAERSSLALQKLIRSRATVNRSGETKEVDSEDLVPGDVVHLESGQRVPADLRLIHSRGLEIDESALTGESTPVSKDATWIGEEKIGLGDRLNMAFAGSMTVRGRGKGIVVETGSRTQVGQIAKNVTEANRGEPPLLIRMRRFTRVVAIVVLIAAALSGFSGVMIHRYPVSEMFLFAVALAVAAIPEGLPVAMTVALSVATRRMSRVGVIVRRLLAVEGLGSCTMIGTDKTGTLTQNQLTVKTVLLPTNQRLHVSGEGYNSEGKVLQDGEPPDPDLREDLARVARAAALCNEGHLRRRDGEWNWR